MGALCLQYVVTVLARPASVAMPCGIDFPSQSVTFDYREMAFSFPG